MLINCDVPIRKNVHLPWTLGNSKKANWVASKTDGGRDGGEGLNEVEFLVFLLCNSAISFLDRVAFNDQLEVFTQEKTDRKWHTAVCLATVARVGDTRTTAGARESDGEDGHCGSKEKSELGEHGYNESGWGFGISELKSQWRSWLFDLRNLDIVVTKFL